MFKKSKAKKELKENPVYISTSILENIVANLGADSERISKDSIYRGLSYTIREHLIKDWIQTQQQYYVQKAKRVYYLSLEFLPGPFLKNNIINTGLENNVDKELKKNFDYSLEQVAEEECEPGLGNGGLGRLASCFMDSMATLKVPGYGYGIRYAYGMFKQEFQDGRQIEKADNWLRFSNIWEYDRTKFLYRIQFGGHVHQYLDEKSSLRTEWVETEDVWAMACDILVPGYKNEYCSNMRLWAAKATAGFNLETFNHGEYIKAMQKKIESENISMVLYPNDQSEQGKELRLKQQYFLVSATIQDIMRRHSKSGNNMTNLPNEAVIHLNETHPAVAIPELMRLLLDEHFMDWGTAWNICKRTFAYTNHTVLPEALEKWPVKLFERLLPRHLQIIYEINRCFLEEVAELRPDDDELLLRVSLIEEGEVQQVRMSHLAIVGSFSVNGVAALHSEIIKNQVFKDLHDLYPEKFNNKTNGISPRRFLLQANPTLSKLITRKIGEGWITDLDKLKKLIPFADDPKFRHNWMRIKRNNKIKLAGYILQRTGVRVNPDSLFDAQFKRIHEYKRQMLNCLHAIVLYNRIRENRDSVQVPRTILFGGKAAPGYFSAKTIINLINNVGCAVNNDPVVGDRLKLVFLPNYNVKLTEKLLPASDLSEQISTAGMEASGTGNMKFALNGALTIGTLDGANIEIMEEVGKENIFIFGLTADEVAEKKAGDYKPYEVYDSNHELKKAIDMIISGYFSPGKPCLFHDLTYNLLNDDPFLVMADYEDYIRTQDRVSNLYLDPHEWTRKSILNTAQMGKFSSDRTIRQYADEIWKVKCLD